MEVYDHQSEEAEDLEEYDGRDYEDGVDEELESMLYSLVHYQCDNTMVQATDQPPQYTLNSAPDIPYIFSVTTLTEDSSDASLVNSAKSTTVSFKKRSSSREHAQRDDENQAKKGKANKGDTNNIQSKSDIQEDGSSKSQMPDVICLDSTSSTAVSDEDSFRPPQKKGKSCENQVPDIICIDSTSDTKISDRDSDHLQGKKGRFDMEAELGIPASSPNKKLKKTKPDKNTPLQTSKPDIRTTLQTTDHSKVGKRAPPAEKNHRKTLNQLLTDRPRPKNVKDIVVIKSDSSSSSSSSDSEISAESECSSASDSDSDTGVLGSTSVHRSLDASAAECTLDLNWNVTSADRQTIESVEKRSSQADKTLWKISDADAVPATKSRVSRYYAKIRCHNCDKEGHLSKNCPVAKKKPNCGLCGTEDHLMHRCPNRLCFNCSQPGHSRANCPLPKKDRFVKCARCLFRGHAEDECPDLWRQYHLTITTSKDLTPSKKQVNSQAYCCNCAKRGHFSFDCRQERMDRFIFPPRPIISRYDVDSSKKRIDLDSEDTSRAKKFKSNHHHSANQRTWNDQQLYPRGSQSAGHRSKPCNQRYFDAQASYQRTSSSRRSHMEGGQKVHSTVYTPSHKDRAPGKSHVWGFDKKMKFTQHLLSDGPSWTKDKRRRQSDWGGQVEWQGEEDFHRRHGKSWKRESLHRGKDDWGGFDHPTPPKKKKDKTGGGLKHKKLNTSQQDTRDEARSRKKEKKQRKGQPWTEGRHNRPHSSQQPHQDNAQTGKNKRQRKSQEGRQQPKLSTSQPSTSSHRAVVTSKGGFRTTMKTMNYNRNSLNTQQS
ncbi:hypothetical protein ACOMHN_052628 [Nucella lapillus]